ncbi:hypothetical protein Phi18:3_gp051 [Cellulophaga phage phi18:3]|uniref:Uncharacterized protein n=1 Tax=Cellulophaga phage phi18:3 TaxID=1327983 RepID=S0A323_9CAUD|nr:hypothetical protein Phi18:3_gp051 [Cellulophaga phage phi18:3]AGO48563.1 hypothetical protein Phi18:3_gp051 [Cellulophaga phage phi18:3]
MYKNGTYKKYRGYGITKNRGWWTAEAYANPTFHSSNLSDIKKQIRNYQNN